MSDLAIDTSKPLEFDEYGVVRVGPMRIGFVEPGRIAKRRENPRAMSESELNALRASVDSLGFKSFIISEEIEPGRYGIVDGHHRMQVLSERGAPRIPILLLDPGTDPNMVDLAMLSFNVTGSPNGPVFVDFVRELVDKMGVELVASHVALDAAMLTDLSATLDEAMAALDTPSEGSGEDSDLAGEGWQGRPLRIEIANTPETRDLIAKVRQLTGEPTDGQAVVSALKAYVSHEELPSTFRDDEAELVEDDLPDDGEGEDVAADEDV